MTRTQLVDLIERAAWTAVQSAVAAFALGMGWKAIAAAGIGAGLSVLKTGARALTAKDDKKQHETPGDINT